MASYTLQGECLDAAILLGRFNAMFPKIDDAGNFTSLVSSSFNGTAITYSVTTRQITNNGLYSRTGTLAVTTCDPAQNYKAFTIPDAEDFGAAWSAGFVTPMAIGFVAWCCSKIVSMWND